MTRFPFGLPDGWFPVAYADEIAPGEVQPLRYFDRELVLFRTQAGHVAVLDAFCPHLGAHLGVGGRVTGEHLACPFHGWSFDVTGACVALPGGAAVPRGAVTPAWPAVSI